MSSFRNAATLSTKRVSFIIPRTTLATRKISSLYGCFFDQSKKLSLIKNNYYKPTALRDFTSQSYYYFSSVSTSQQSSHDGDDDDNDDFFLNELLKYKEKHGDCAVPPWPISKLGKWVEVQRRKEKSCDGNLVTKLDEIGFVWNYPEYIFNLRFKELQEYKAKYHDCAVPLKFPENPALGYWVRRQRKEYKQKEGSSLLTEEEIAKLDDVGFIWDYNENRFNLRVQELLEYQETHGTMDVKKTSSGLGLWVQKQRMYYKKYHNGEKSTLTKDRIEKLDEIGFIWDYLDYKFDLFLTELAEYKKQHGDCNVPEDYYNSENPSLGAWVKNLRTRKPKTLTEDRLEKLEELGFTWRRSTTNRK